MIQKIKNYYNAFGLKQTILKLFRYAVLKAHIDKDGIYHPSRKDNKSITKKNNKIVILSKDYYKDDISNKSSEICNYLNISGFKVYYYYLLPRDNSKHKFIPLCEYKSLSNVKKEYINNEFILTDDINNIDEYIKNNNKVLSFEDFIDNSFDLITSYFSRDTLRKKYNKKISIVVLNYNNMNVIFNCIDSLIKYNHYGYEIIVVDNGSVDGSYEIIKKNYKNIKLLRNTKNGCSSGRNLGVRNSDRDYILFLDSDQWPISDLWLDNYLEIIDNNFEGVIGWTAGWFNNRGIAYHTVDNFNYRYMPPYGLYRNDVGYLGSGGMLLRRDLFEKIGGFDINYDPTCYEDTDISLEARNIGKEIIYCPYLSIEHKAHQTTKSGSKKHLEMINKNGKYFLNKWKSKNSKLLKYRK